MAKVDDLDYPTLEFAVVETMRNDGFSYITGTAWHTVGQWLDRYWKEDDIEMGWNAEKFIVTGYSKEGNPFYNSVGDNPSEVIMRCIVKREHGEEVEI